jgi:hypothetical protein
MAYPASPSRKQAFKNSDAAYAKAFNRTKAPSIVGVFHLIRLKRSSPDRVIAPPYRNFESTFQLAEHVEVKGATLENGPLHVDLAREVPEAMKFRPIPIMSSRKVLEVKPTQVAA